MVTTFDHVINEIASLIALITFGFTVIRFIVNGGRKRIAKMLVIVGATIEILGIISNNFINNILQTFLNLTVSSIMLFYFASGICGVCLIIAGLLFSDDFWKWH